MDKKGNVNGKLMDVISLEDYYKNPDLHEVGFTAIEHGDTLYPLRRNNQAPGYFPKSNIMGQFIHPLEEDQEKYSAKNVIDFGSSKDMKDIIEKKAAFKNMEREILCDPDNITKPVVRENDSPEMKAFKQAICDKNIDINKYEPRFGSSFSNDKRLLNKDSITLNKLVNMSDILDIKVTITLEDKDENVPNPMGRVISVELTGGYNDEE
ncbi:MAG: hypothetical protein ACRDD7_02185 [Peptostreptococcaceae bacterium]